METLQLVLFILERLSIVTKDPVFEVRDRAITTLLTVVQLAQGGARTAKALRELATHVAQMASEGRDPTDAEWEVLRAASDAAHDIIQSFQDEPEPVPPAPTDPEPAKDKV